MENRIILILVYYKKAKIANRSKSLFAQMYYYHRTAVFFKNFYYTLFFARIWIKNFLIYKLDYNVQDVHNPAISRLIVYSLNRNDRLLIGFAQIINTFYVLISNLGDYLYTLVY